MLIEWLLQVHNRFINIDVEIKLSKQQGCVIFPMYQFISFVFLGTSTSTGAPMIFHTILKRTYKLNLKDVFMSNLNLLARNQQAHSI